MDKDKRTIGIVGGGQLGKMLTDAAHALGFRVIVLGEVDSPASQVADEYIVGTYIDKDKVLELGSKSDFITYEVEGANEEALLELEKSGKPVNPSGSILKSIKDKYEQKILLDSYGIPVAEFKSIESVKDCEDAGEIFGYPFVLKSRLGAYDGRGNFVVKESADISTGFQKLGEKLLYAEKFVPFEKELAVVTARDIFGHIIAYPIVETIHKNNICHVVKSPAEITDQEKQNGETLARKVLEALGGVGVFAIEMFLTEDNQILINEIAPRVHNSGHHTIEAFDMSQFEAQIRSVAGMHLGEPKPLAKHAVMVNILGEREGEANFKVNEPTYGANVHIYGKMQVRKERKMGHITAIGEDRKETEERALIARKSIQI